MPGYRLYYITPDGHIDDARELAFVDDDEAIQAVEREFADGRAMELWQRARVVRKFDGAGELAWQSPSSSPSDAGLSPDAEG